MDEVALELDLRGWVVIKRQRRGRKPFEASRAAGAKAWSVKSAAFLEWPLGARPWEQREKCWERGRHRGLRQILQDQPASSWHSQPINQHLPWQSPVPSSAIIIPWTLLNKHRKRVLWSPFDRRAECDSEHVINLRLNTQLVLQSLNSFHPLRLLPDTSAPAQMVTGGLRTQVASRDYIRLKCQGHLSCDQHYLTVMEQRRVF